MNLKSLLAIFIIIGIGVILLRTESGMGYATGVVDFLRDRVGNIVSGLFGMAGGGGPVEGAFGLTMTADKNSFLTQSYQLYNSSLSSSGLVQGVIKIGGVDLHKEDMAVRLDLDGTKGAFEYTLAGTLRFDGTVKKIDVDGNYYTSGSGDLKVSFEIVPIEFLVTNLSEKKISLKSAIGSIARLNPDGSIKSTEELAGEQLELYQFAGSLKLAGSNIVLQGSASSVSGTSPKSSFKW